MAIQGGFIVSEIPSSNMEYNGNELVFVDKPNVGVAGIAQDQPDRLGHEIAKRWNKGGSTHTVEEDFEHYLAYTQQHNVPDDLKAKLFDAYQAAW
jgi:hypothetical protein